MNLLLPKLVAATMLEALGSLSAVIHVTLQRGLSPLF